MKSVLVVYGTRPEAIKVAPVIKTLRGHPNVTVRTAVTGQHREMLDQVNDLFDIVPDHDLDLMSPGATLADLSSRALGRLADVLQVEGPDAVVVQGDTSTAFIAALAAFYGQIPVIHVEAGLRTGDLTSPFPEEGNRQLIGRLATLHLAPTETSRMNLLAEGVDPTSIVVTGNTVIDALQDAVSKPVSFADVSVARLIASGERFVLVTAHRRESWGAPMAEAMAAVREQATADQRVRWVVPMHRNPVVRTVIEGALAGLANVILVEPLSYHEFCHVMEAAYLLLTDSGGVQEEAPSLGKPVLVMRDTTERPEAVHAGTVRLVGTDRGLVGKELHLLLTDQDAYQRMANAVNPYGDGVAAARSVAAIEALFGLGPRMPDFIPLNEEI